MPADDYDFDFALGDDFDFEFGFGGGDAAGDEPEEDREPVMERLLEGNPPTGEGATAAEDIEGEKHRSVSVFKTMCTAKKMKLLSEAALDEVLDWHLEEGVAYHCISFGDVDSLTYLRHIVRQEPLEYVMISTWCMAMEDAEEIAQWVDRGMVGRVDFYVGEIFKNGYRGVRDAIEAVARSCGGRVARFRNHSKIMAGFGSRLSFAIESSANINTNPRTEQAVITVDRGLAEFYKEFFDGINSFDGGFEDWEPYQLGGGGDARAERPKA